MAGQTIVQSAATVGGVWNPITSQFLEQRKADRIDHGECVPSGIKIERPTME